MSAEKTTRDSGLFADQPFLTGIIAGIIAAVVTGIVIHFGFNPDIIGVHIPETIGQSGDAVGWVLLIGIGAILGLVYAALAQAEALAAYLDTPRTAGIAGLGYGIVLWVLAIIVVPFIEGDGVDGIGEYAVTVDGFLGYALLGVLIGVGYLLLPLATSR